MQVSLCICWIVCAASLRHQRWITLWHSLVSRCRAWGVFWFRQIEPSDTLLNKSFLCRFRSLCCAELDAEILREERQLFLAQQPHPSLSQKVMIWTALHMKPAMLCVLTWAKSLPYFTSKSYGLVTQDSWKVSDGRGFAKILRSILKNSSMLMHFWIKN